jgi:DNA-binding GntR family transcriptional regulator
MLQLSLDPDSALPLADQIVIGIRTRIEDRVLRPGMRLPRSESSRSATR